MRKPRLRLTIIVIYAFILTLNFGCNLKTKDRKKDKVELINTTSSNSESENLVNYMIHELMKLPSTPPGISLAISSNQKVVYSKGYGYTSLKTKQPITPTTQFRAGSLSRLITITSLAKLIEKEKLNFNDTVQNLLPDYPNKEYKFTVKQLAAGLSGMQHYTSRDNFSQSRYKNVDDALAVFSKIPLSHKPGDTYQFSIHSYTLLSKILEEVSNRDFPTLVKEDIFLPLTMTSTSIENVKNKPKQMTNLFNFSRNGMNEGYFTQIDSLKDYSYSWAGAGIISTPTDLLKLANGYTNGFIKKEQLISLFEIQQLNSGDTIRQSIGWDKNWDMDDKKVIEQDGSAEGTRTIVSVFPDQNLSISLMSNAFSLRAIEETAHTLAIPFLTKPSPQKQPKSIYKLEIHEDVRGEWIKRNGFMVLNGENDRLIIDSNTNTEEVYKLIYLNRKNKYALIHPDGILYTEINIENEGIITGKVMYYRGPNLHKTSIEPPYLKFKSLKKNSAKN